MLRCWFVLLLLAWVSGPIDAYADDRRLLRDEFENLDAWEPFFFPNIRRHTTYEIRTQGDVTVLAATSSGSASALVSQWTFNIAEYPIIHWRWKVDNLYAKGNYRLKSGDDYPIRVYVLFTYDPERATMAVRFKYGLAKSLYGRYPPLRSLNYIWANREDETEMVFSPFTQRAVMIPLQHGSRNIGQWVEETVNVLEDYKSAFGDKPPPKAHLAIMNDADNTGEGSTAYIQFIEVRKSIPGFDGR